MGGTHKTHLRKLQVILNLTDRWILGAGRRTKTAKLMQDCGWLNIGDLIEYQTLVSTWKIIWLQAPLYLKQRINTVEDYKIETDRSRLQSTQLGFRPRAVNCWNKLPIIIRSNQSITSFKKNLKTWMKAGRPPETDTS